MESLKKMKECLIGVAEGQVYGNLEKVNAQELGEVMDMIKDLSEAVYYCTITESMEKQSHEEKSQSMYYDPRYEERYYPTMYATNGNGGGGRSSMTSTSRNYNDGMIRRYDDGQTSYSMYTDGRSHYPMYPEMTRDVYREGMMRDPREGRSGERRKMYMEGKKMHHDKAKQMQELESYMQELASDMSEMIQDASPEEKQLLQQKIAVLASKVK